MPRPLASALTVALVAAVSIVPGPWSPSAAAEEPAPPQTAITLAGGGRGASGPASRALLNSYSRIDAAPDGTLLVEDSVQLMRVDPARDSLTVIPWPDVTGAWGISDVAADGSSVVLATANHVKRIAPDGTVSYLWERSGVAALDIGADPAQPWSPDGVRATDAYLGAVRGSAGLPDGRVVLTTAVSYTHLTLPTKA